MKVTIAGVSKFFGQVRALHDVNLEIADGELFFLLGPSGCGKTTLLRCIGGFESVSGGQIMLNGEDVASRPANERNTAMVFQGYALWPHMTVAENVAFGLEMRKVPKDERERRVREALQRVQIEHLRQRKPNELSGGQQQRVALARTLVVEPGCLLLDEPLANLDAKLRRDMRREIRRLCKDSGLTGIYVTHDRQEALSMADRVAV
ncbi:MAG TPA: ABC transporter ATP-binding protein, partial [Lentisphaeria bacterium]|nr:ABC transporter ATP-binding protein [Lentisphaeria bacterium]